jgi:hypothetical protein
LLVFEIRVPAFKSEFPEAHAPAQGIPAPVAQTGTTDVSAQTRSDSPAFC